MSRDEQLAVLDGALGRGYEDFDGFILAERARAQRESDELGADPAGLYDEAGGPAGGGGFGLDGIISSGVIQPGGSGRDGESGQVAQAGGSGGSVGGPQGGPAGEEGQFPIPDDIPSGRDDDVVARQIREAAMNEPDPELRERLWDEYRRYTGID